MKRCGEFVGYVVVNPEFWPNPVVCGEGSEIYTAYKEAYRELRQARRTAGNRRIRMMLVVDPRSRNGGG